MKYAGNPGRLDRKSLIRAGTEAAVLALLIGIVSTGRIPVLNDVFRRTEDTAEYSRYLSDNAIPAASEDGELLQSAGNMEYTAAASCCASVRMNRLS